MRFLLFVFLSGTMFVGCQTIEEGSHTPHAEDSGIPKDTQPTSLKNIVSIARKAANYISFDYSADGCSDRTIMISAELASSGVPSNALFLVPAMQPLTPRQYPKLEWNYHVAPVIYLEDTSALVSEHNVLKVVGGKILGTVHPGAYVVDPALYPIDIVAPVETWVADMTGNGQDAFLATYDSREALNTPTNDEQALKDAALVLPRTIEQMPKHWQFQLSSACSFLSRDAINISTPADVSAIRKAMNEGTTALLTRMLDLNLLLKPTPISQFPCWDS